MNIKLFEEIKAKIRAESQLFFMRDWKSNTDCGTAFCIAGWACALKDENLIRSDLSDAYCFEGHGIGNLCITESQAKRLFRISYWPTRFAQRAMKLSGFTPELAELACEVIDDFIATKGWDYPEYHDVMKQVPDPAPVEQIQFIIPKPRQLA